ncbi:MAG: hypothetical protein P8N09_09400 [Planctomycetota bacterium]|jgi:hypothetical protein|nr:hypothetical protein [Planctomycetota bacterium]
MIRPMLALQEASPIPFFTMDGEMDLLGGWLICFLTLSVFSFLYKDNPFYKIAEHTFVGAGTAFFALQYYSEGILEPLYVHINHAMQLPAGELMQLGGYGVDPTYAIIFRSVAVLFSIFLLSRMVFPNGWAPRWPLAVMVGVYAALKLTGETQSKLVLQVASAMQPLTNPEKLAWSDNWVAVEETQVFYTFANTVMVVGLICALAHFIFTYKRTKILGGVSRVGIIVLMITFGSMFGFTVLGRYALLIERVDTLGGFNNQDYALFGTSALSPPILLTVLIALVLAVSLRGKNSTSTS